MSHDCRLGVASHQLIAQNVSGRLIDGLTQAPPIERGFIVLLDESGAELERVLTDALGSFTIVAPSGGRFQLRSERIGFRAGLSDPFDLAADGSHQLDMVVNPVVVRLDTLTVSGDSRRCRVVGEQGMETATVWKRSERL